MFKKILILIIILSLVPVVLAETTSGKYPSQLSKQQGLYNLEFLFGNTQIENTGEVEIGMCTPRIIDYLKDVSNIELGKSLWRKQNPICNDQGSIAGDIVVTQTIPTKNIMGAVRIKKYQTTEAHYFNSYAKLISEKININKYEANQNVLGKKEFFIVKSEGKMTYNKNNIVVTCYDCSLEIHSSKPNLFTLTGEAVAMPETTYNKYKFKIELAMDLHKDAWADHLTMPKSEILKIKDFKYVDIGSGKSYTITESASKDNKGKAVINLKGYGYSVNSKLANTKIRGVVEFILTNQVIVPNPVHVLKANNVYIENIKDIILVDVKNTLNYKTNKQNVFKTYDYVGFFTNDVTSCTNKAYNCMALSSSEMNFLSGNNPVYRPFASVGPTMQPTTKIIFYKNDFINQFNNKKLKGTKDFIAIRNPAIKSSLISIIITETGVTLPNQHVNWDTFGTSISSETAKGLLECKLSDKKCYLNGKELLI